MGPEVGGGTLSLPPPRAQAFAPRESRLRGAASAGRGGFVQAPVGCGVADREGLKRKAGEAAAELVQDGMVVGLGTGSTVRHFIEALGKRVAAGLKVQGI